MADVFDGPIAVAGVYKHAPLARREDDSLMFMLPERISFDPDDEYTMHVCQGNERLRDLAIKYYYRAHYNPLDLWPIIRDFQPEPIQDASIPLKAGTIVYMPSDEFIEEIAHGDPLSDTPEV
jgi:hypothetical protein